jgi:hypothetical protein
MVISIVDYREEGVLGESWRELVRGKAEFRRAVPDPSLAYHRVPIRSTDYEFSL